MRKLNGAPSLSPRELADAIGTSESSVKRWVDAGHIRATRTAGGHRRIELLPALEFIASTRRTVKRPEILCPEGTLSPEELADDERAGTRLFEVLESGDMEEAVRLIVASHALARRSVAAICDGMIRMAMQRIGELWDGGFDGIFVEHRSVPVVARALTLLEQSYDVDEALFSAVGGAIGADTSILPAHAASAVLASEGFRSTNLGANTPTEVLLDAIARDRFDMVWVSVSHVDDANERRRSITRLHEQLSQIDVPLLIGGREVASLSLPSDVERGSSMEELAAFARRIKERSA